MKHAFPIVEDAADRREISFLCLAIALLFVSACAGGAWALLQPQRDQANIHPSSNCRTAPEETR